MTEAHGELTLEQKAFLVTGRDFWSTHEFEGAGVASVVMTDGPHGVRRQTAAFDQLVGGDSLPATCFPLAAAVGASWDVEVARAIGAAIGREARAQGVHVALGPGVNIKRSPLCGRNFEYYSEDPLLSGVLGAAHVAGQQGEGVGASLKHFAANNQETDRMRVSAEVDERTLREIYLSAFERVVREARPATVMCAYNRVNGVPASEHHWLLTEVLRDEWGFEGAVVSDWGAVDDRVAALRAGLDLEMPGIGERSARNVMRAVASADLPVEVLDEAVERVRGLARWVRPPEGVVDVDAHDALARSLAARCVVLVKNDAAILPLREGVHVADDGAVLPLREGVHVALLGEFARTARIQGGGSSHVHPTRVTTVLDGLREVGARHAATIDFAAGYSLGGDDDVLRDEAVALASGADVVVVVAGLRDEDEEEGADRTSLELPAAQVALLRAVARLGRPLVVVLVHGGVVTMEEWHDDVAAILDGSLLGQAGGGALADVLFGEVSPSGRLAETIPRRLEDNPSFLNYPGEQGRVCYGEGVMVGYRCYETTGQTVRYPFGHGLSYTTFAVRDLAVEATGPDSARATVTLTNTGARAGAYVVQLYVATAAGPVRRPRRELRWFTKVHLEPGASRVVVADLDRRAFAYYDVARAAWVVSPGAYEVQVCENASSVLETVTIDLAGDLLTTPLTMDATVEEWFSHPVVGPLLVARVFGDGAEGALGGADLDPGLMRMALSMPMRKIAAMLGDALPRPYLAELMELSRGVETT